MPYCTKCGKEVNAGHAFCRYCGSPLSFRQPSPRSGVPPAPESGLPGNSEAEMAAFIGKNADRYLAKFRGFSADGGRAFAVTWHWPAFLFGFFWLVYRKLYLWALIALLLGFLPCTGIVAHVAFGLTANFLYFTAVRRRIREIRAVPSLSDADRAAAIVRAGGTNGAALVVAPVVGMAVAGIIAAVAVPSFVSYRQRANDAQARTEVQEACRRLSDLFLQEPDLTEVTPEDLLETGFSPSPDIEMMLLDGRRGTLGLSAQHKEGKSVFIADPSCAVREELKGPSEQI